ncbi:hypothetical protein LTR15_005073 [Elasticomyces elasticus]|nr:hypothetical protein LTR15_005073 [Elasticomyces elasticus]
MALQNVVIIGGGWAGYTLSRSLDDKRFQITVISPEPTSPYTPLLASAACGLFSFSLVGCWYRFTSYISVLTPLVQAEDSIRHKRRAVRLIQARVRDIDFEKKICSCNPAFPKLADQIFDVSYDSLIIAPGCETNTFNTPGVSENALFVRTVADAMAVRQRLLDILEMASLPNMTEVQQRNLLHIIVVGGGPTGVEITAEMYDLVHNDLIYLYPDLAGKISVAIHDVAAQILSVFDAKLAEYALSSFTHHDVEIKTASHITKVDNDTVYTKEDGAIKATGNRQVPLVDSLKLTKSARLPRIQTDYYLHPLRLDGTPISDVYAVGDAADITGGELPTTAEAACQKGEYVAKVLNTGRSDPFVYQQKMLVAYTGQHDGVIAGRKDWTGGAAWVAWRSKNLTWARSWRNKILIVTTWMLNYTFGKEIARA